MPEVTVSMPARNSAPFIHDAVSSVLRQRGVDVELVVVDDGSTDGTARMVERFRDPRLRLLRNATTEGIGACHNRVIRMTDAPYIAHVDSDDVIRQTALARVVARLERSPTVGQVYCNHYVLEAGERATLAEFRRQRRRLRGLRDPEHVRRDLLLHGMVVNTLRTYRREVFDAVGGFDEELDFAVDYDMALRVAEAFDLELVSDFLYLQRRHAGNVSEAGRFPRLRGWWKRARICHDRLRAGGGRLLGRTAPEVYGLLALGLLHLTGLPDLLKRLRDGRPPSGGDGPPVR